MDPFPFPDRWISDRKTRISTHDKHMGFAREFLHWAGKVAFREADTTLDHVWMWIALLRKLTLCWWCLKTTQTQPLELLLSVSAYWICCGRLEGGGKVIFPARHLLFHILAKPEEQQGLGLQGVVKAAEGCLRRAGLHGKYLLVGWPFDWLLLSFP